MSRVGNEHALSKLISYLYIEVFQKKEESDSSPINKAVHSADVIPVLDDVKGQLDTSSNIFQWGPGGFSDEVNTTPHAGRWGFGAIWG
jgi:hypothetical protein